MAKLLENIFRSVNIALVNELAVLADRMGIDIYEVIDAAATKPFGFMRFDPGPGMGGHCLPVDPFYLSWKAREYDFSTEFIELAGKVNQHMPYVCVEQRRARAQRAGQAGQGLARSPILGVAYKPGVGDIRESPALKIIDRLQPLGADVAYHDAFVPELPAVRPRQRLARGGPRGRRPRADRHRPPGHRPHGDRGAAADGRLARRAAHQRASGASPADGVAGAQCDGQAAQEVAA